MRKADDFEPKFGSYYAYNFTVAVTDMMLIYASSSSTCRIHNNNNNIFLYFS